MLRGRWPVCSVLRQAGQEVALCQNADGLIISLSWCGRPQLAPNVGGCVMLPVPYTVDVWIINHSLTRSLIILLCFSKPLYCL